MRSRNKNLRLILKNSLTLLTLTSILLPLIFSFASSAYAVEVVQKGVPFTPQEDGLYFTEAEARTIYRQKLEAEMRVELAESTLARRDEQMEMLYNEFKDYIKVSTDKEEALVSEQSTLKQETNVLKVLLGIVAVAGIIF